MNMRSLPVIIMGITSILIQITALRQLMSVFSGNELDIGITLSVWLTAVGIGSYAGHRFRQRNALAFSFIAVALLSQPTILFINLIRPLLSIEFGETIPLLNTVFFTVISLLPLCIVIGLQFPLAVSYLGGNAAKAYGLEAIGAFSGGALFTFLLSGRVTPSTISMAVSLINFAAAVFLIRKKYLIPLLIIPAIFYFGTEKVASAVRWKGAELILKTESRYGEIEVLKLREQSNLYSSGKFFFSYPDRQSEEMRAHIPMSVSASPSDILIIGGSVSVLGEFLKYDLNSIDFVEIDPKIIDISMGLLPAGDRQKLNDRRLRIIATDARKFTKGLKGRRYDLIVLNLSEPSTANTNRFYTVEFFREAKAGMKDGGEIFLSLPPSFGYIGKRMQMANGSVYNSLKKVFRNVELSSEEYGIMIASENGISTDPAVLEKRFSERGIKTQYFHPYIFHDAFAGLKKKMVRERLEKAAAINTDKRPAAYLYNLMLWAEMQGSAVLAALLEHKNIFAFAAIFLLALSAAALWKKKETAYFSVFSTGFSSMAFSMIILLAYQASYGYVYEMIGMITAVFMLGVAAGAHISRTFRKALPWMMFSEALTVMLLLASPLFFMRESLFYALSLINGLLAGIEFSAANIFLKEKDRIMAAGRFYAFDLAGSFLGAFTCSIFLVPLFGIQNTIAFVVLIKAITLALLFSIRHEKN
ncbi:MAG: hypothetical protein EPN94_09275 [Nitrospirae bacterium]|nr:MAG: hypothetical protein EPN94_09275 [Nitrospirota bacterium]